MKVIIMAGGRGERLWPLSRTQNPKQLTQFPLPNQTSKANSTLLSQTFERLKDVVPTHDIFFSIQENILTQTRKALPSSLNDSQFILEPEAKDTTSAILLSLLKVTAGNKHQDEVFFFTPADHYITPLEPYQQALLLAEKTANASNLLTVIGITPQHPATEYGYLETHPYKTISTHTALLQTESASLQDSVLYVSQFHEKPDLKKATTYLKKGNFLWNAGMFFCKAAPLLRMFEEWAPDHVTKVQTYLTLLKKGEKSKALNVFNTIEKKSFDYAIAEKLKHILCIPAQFTWDDLGSFAAIERLQHSLKTQEGNIFLNKTHAFNTHDTFVHNTNEKKQTLITNGIKNLSVIITEDVIYITDKTHGIPTKDVLKKLPDTCKTIL